jgi:hypothetical protein
MNPMYRRAVLITSALFSAALAVHAQEHPIVRDHAGGWRAPDVRTVAVPADVRAAAVRVADALMAIIRRAPSMAPAAGFEVVPHTFIRVDNIDRSDNPKLPTFVSIQVTANLAPFERIGAAVAANERDTAASVTMLVNDLSHTATTPMGDDWADPQGGFITDADDPVETSHGFPVYQDGNLDKWALIRRHDLPVLAPVSRERYLLVAITHARSNLARAEAHRAAIPAGVPANLVATIDDGIGHMKTQAANLQRQLDRMSAAEHRLPAIVGSPSGDDPAPFVDAGEGSSVRFYNPALFDSALPPATPQTLSVRMSGNDDLIPGLADTLNGELDWDALAKIVR